MGQQDRAEPKPYSQADKQQHQRNTGYNFRIQHGDIGNSHHDGPVPFFHSIDGDTGDSSYYSGYCR